MPLNGFLVSKSCLLYIILLVYRIGITYVSSRYDVSSWSLKLLASGEHGIPEGPGHLIPLIDKSRSNIFHGLSNT